MVALEVTVSFWEYYCSLSKHVKAKNQNHKQTKKPNYNKKQYKITLFRAKVKYFCPLMIPVILHRQLIYWTLLIDLMSAISDVSEREEKYFTVFCYEVL